MPDIAPEVVSIADACLGSLQGRSALLIGPAKQRYPYLQLLRQLRIKIVYQEDTPVRVPQLLPYVQLMINLPADNSTIDAHTAPADRVDSTLITAATIAKGCQGRRSPLLIFDLVSSGSVEELAGLLPAVCLYTPEDIRTILDKIEMKAS
ncbi:hypothetical protein ccbrp13_43130 [Ktedonobacteria bacterium brp13]|nr:hypothetical protein ccbrp13_43130 [Ktedonobacteria bacterium brp13]